MFEPSCSLPGGKRAKIKRRDHFRTQLNLVQNLKDTVEPTKIMFFHHAVRKNQEQQTYHDCQTGETYLEIRPAFPHAVV